MAKVLIGEIKTEEGKLDEATKILREASMHKNKAVGDYAKFLMLNLGFEYHKKGEVQKAFAMFAQASQQNFDLEAKYMAFKNMGLIYRDRNDFENAIKYFDTAINQNDYPGVKYFAIYEKSILLRNQKKFTEEAKLLRQLAKQDIIPEKKKYEI